MARYFFGEQNPIGKKFGLEGNPGDEFEIVGVVGDAKYLNLREKPPRTFYLDGFQRSLGPISFEIRTLAQPSSQEQAILTSLKPILGGSQLYGFKALEQQINESLSHEQLVASLSALFALLAVVLAAVGLYGIMAYGVEQRTNEIGIRMALGAQRASVLQLVLGQGIKMAFLGIVFGGLAALASARLLSSLFFGVTSTDPVTFLCVLALVALVAVAACYIPARRAMRVDPMVALRYE